MPGLRGNKAELISFEGGREVQEGKHMGAEPSTSEGAVFLLCT